MWSAVASSVLPRTGDGGESTHREWPSPLSSSWTEPTVGWRCDASEINMKSTSVAVRGLAMHAVRGISSDRDQRARR